MGWRIYIDEAGDRGVSRASSAHFVATAIAVRDDDDAKARAELDALRCSLGRQPGQVLHFQRFSHSQRLKAVQDLAGSSVAAIFNVVLCKRGFREPSPADMRNIIKPDPFRVQKLHDYRRALERDGTGVHWASFKGHRFRTATPEKVELLQFADTAASALFRALEPDEFGNHERRYLEELVPKLYRRDPGSITSYGLKVFPAEECADGGSLAWLREL